MLSHLRKYGNEDIEFYVQYAFPWWRFERYAKRSDRNETPPEFIRRVYSPWQIGDGEFLDRMVRALDPNIWVAMDRWAKKNPSLPNMDNFGLIIRDFDPAITKLMSIIRAEERGREEGSASGAVSPDRKAPAARRASPKRSAE